MNFKWIGDLSREDAQVLIECCELDEIDSSILEFGSGGSTQIFAQCMPASVLSIETDPEWIKRTQDHLAKLNEKTPVSFCSYEAYKNIIEDQKFDLIFVDGVDNLRREFAIATWKNLSDDGVMIFHDTRRFNDFQNAAWVAQLHFNEIKKIEVNYLGSNMTVIFKKPYAGYVDWNYTEDKPLWAYGKPGAEDMPLWELKNE